MLVMYGDDETIVIAVVESELADLRGGQMLGYEGDRMVTANVVLMYGKDKADVLDQIRRAGVSMSPELREKYLRNERTDAPRRVF